MTAEQVGGIVRAVISAIGGYFIGKGIADAATVTAFALATVWRRAALPALFWTAVVLPALVIGAAHTPSDVVGGVLLALLVALTARSVAPRQA